MKIRPPDSTNLPPEPEEVSQKKPSSEFSLGETESAASEPPVRSQPESKLLQALSSVTNLSDPAAIGNRSVDLALHEFESAVSPPDLESVRSQLQELLQEDPFTQNKLERISSLLTKDK